MTSSLIGIIYGNNILIYGRSKDEIDDIVKQMKTEDVTLTAEPLWSHYCNHFFELCFRLI
jgi:hypothetical protein